MVVVVVIVNFFSVACFLLTYSSHTRKALNILDVLVCC